MKLFLFTALTRLVAGSLFVDDFSSDLADSRWAPSSEDKFEGTWSIEGEENRSLVVGAEAKHHGISAKFDSPLDPSGKGVVIQYEVRFTKRQECGGAYLKVLQHDAEFDPVSFGDNSQYTIMFGPDRCGDTDKVHFIFRHKNPKTGEYEEKHMTDAPKIKNDLLTHLYTLAVRPDNTYELFIDQQSVNAGSLFEDFEPSVNPPKEIDDPTDQKPTDWVDEEMMDDPTESKPEDWDEAQPQEIDDETASKPDGWDDEGEAMIADPEAEMPEDWDEEDDGEWEAPLIENDVCTNIGCGEWVRPRIANPEYKGKWYAPQVVNPAYKGVWKPKQIPNPNYFEDLQPHAMTAMGAVGFELWTMQDGIHFSNVFIDHSLEAAIAYGESTWLPKNKDEVVASTPTKASLNKVIDFVMDNLIACIATAVVLLFGIIFFCCCRSGSGGIEEEPVVTRKEAAKEVEEENEEEEEEEEKPEEKPKVRRSARKSKKVI